MRARYYKITDRFLPNMPKSLLNQSLKSTGSFKTVFSTHNQPVRMVGTEKCFVTSQNHGYAVDAKTLGADWEELFVNMNDGSNEGIRHKSKPWFSSQFHPEACSGPVDTEFMFDKFVEAMN